VAATSVAVAPNSPAASTSRTVKSEERLPEVRVELAASLEPVFRPRAEAPIAQVAEASSPALEEERQPRLRER